MKKEKQLLKVVGTVNVMQSGRVDTTIGRGIVPLKTGQSALDFISAFLEERAILQAEIHKRGENVWASAPAMFLNEDKPKIFTFTFTQFGLNEIGYYGKDLSKDELVRDFKFLKRMLK